MSILIKICLFTVFLTISGCEQSNEPPMDDEFLIKLSQTDPEYSHDGEKIVFGGLYNEVYAIHIIDYKGNYLGNILEDFGHLSSPSWSPDASKLVTSIKGDLYIVKVNGDSLNRINSSGEDFSCQWSPNGRYIAYTKSICDPDCGIALYDLENSTTTIVGEFGGYAKWNSSSDKIYYYHTVYKNEEGRGIYQGFTVKRVNINNMETDSLWFVDKTEKKIWLNGLAVSANENELLFAASYDYPTRSDIWKVNLETKEIIQLTFDGGACPAYSPDSKKIVYTNTNKNEGGLWIMNSDGTSKKRLTKMQR